MIEGLNSGFRVVKTDSSDNEFLNLTALLDSELWERYGAEQQQYGKHNKTDDVREVILIYSGGYAVGCGAIKEFDGSTAEVKRIFVRKQYRRQGISKSILRKLEQLAEIRCYKACVLETGMKQQEAINLYKDSGYQIIDNYGPYIGMENSICMKKEL